MTHKLKIYKIGEKKLKIKIQKKNLKNGKPHKTQVGCFFSEKPGFFPTLVCLEVVFEVSRFANQFRPLSSLSLYLSILYRSISFSFFLTPFFKSPSITLFLLLSGYLYRE